MERADLGISQLESFLCDSATSRGGKKRLVFLVGIRRNYIFLALDAHVGRK